MVSLLSSYPLPTILIVFFLTLLAIKEVIQLFSYYKNNFKKRAEKEEKIENVDAILEKLDKIEKKTDQRFDAQQQVLDLLVASDKDAIKAFITRQYHYFVQNKGWIDDYSLDCIERRYQHYKAQHGNSFIKKLMQELQALPTSPPKKQQ